MLGSRQEAGGRKQETAQRDSDIPLPPWRLRGCAIVTLEKVSALTSWGTRNSGVLFPIGLRAFVHYDSSPVGIYNEVAHVALTKRGPSIIEMYVDSVAAQIGGRRGWGFPKELATLSWRKRGARAEFQHENQVFHFRVSRIGFPVSLRAFVVQNLNGECVRVPFKIRGRARLAFSGRQCALWVEDFGFDVLAPQSNEKSCSL